MILATFMYTTDIKPTTTTLMYIRYFLFPKYPTSIMNNILLQYFRKMSLSLYWLSISICCVRPTYVVQQIVIKEFSLRMAQRFPKWPHKSDGPFSCAAKRENHFSWIFAHLLLLLQSMYLYSFAMYVWKLSRNCGKTRRHFRHHKLVAESWKSRHMQNGNWCWHNF